MYSVEENAHRILLETLRITTGVDQSYHKYPSKERDKADVPCWLIRAAYNWQSYTDSISLSPDELYSRLVGYPNVDMESVSLLADIVNIEPEGLSYMMFTAWNESDDLTNSFFYILFHFLSEKQGKRIPASEIKEKVDVMISEVEYYLDMPIAEQISVKTNMGDMTVRDDGMAAIGTKQAWFWLPFVGLNMVGRSLEITPESDAFSLETVEGIRMLSPLDRSLPFVVEVKKRKHRDALAVWMEENME